MVTVRMTRRQLDLQIMAAREIVAYSDSSDVDEFEAMADAMDAMPADCSDFVVYDISEAPTMKERD